VARRVLYRASSVQVLGGLINGHLGVAARIAAVRRSSPDVCPPVPTLIAAEFPVLAVEATLAALTSFTPVGPLGLPWSLPLICVAPSVTVSAGLRHLALRKSRELWQGLAVLRSVTTTRARRSDRKPRRRPRGLRASQWPRRRRCPPCRVRCMGRLDPPRRLTGRERPGPERLP
jgi:hypothetical protein